MPNGEDKNWIRLCAALDGFFTRYGYWPKRVALNHYGLEDLHDCLFTPASFQRIRERVDLVLDEDASVVAQGDGGENYDYGNEGFPDTRPAIPAGEWLAVSPDRHGGDLGDLNAPRPEAADRFDISLGGRVLHWLTPAECLREAVRFAVYDRQMTATQVERAVRQTIWEVVVSDEPSESDTAAGVTADGRKYVLTDRARRAGFPSILYALELSFPYGTVSWKHSKLALEQHVAAPVANAPAVLGTTTDHDTVDGRVYAMSASEAASLLKRPIERCGLSVRALNCLKLADITTLGELAEKDPSGLVALKNFGQTSLRTVASALARFGLNFGMRLNVENDRITIIQQGTNPRYLFPDLVSEADVALVGSMPQSAEQGTSVLTRDILPVPLREQQVWPPIQSILDRPLYDVVAETGMGEKELSAYLQRVVDFSTGSENGQGANLLEEVAAAIQGAKERDRVAAIKYFGLNGSSGLTLEQIGAEFGVTRERIRQLVARFESGMKSIRPPLPTSALIRDSLRSFGAPVTLEEWREAVPESVRPRNASDLLVLRELERWGWLPESSWIENNGTWLVAAGGGREDELAKAARERRDALSSYLAWGAAYVDDVVASSRLAAPMITGALRANPKWRDVGRGWFVRTGSSGGVLGGRMRLMLSILGELRLEEIRRGLRRAARKPVAGRRGLRVPPTRILAELAIEMGLQVGRRPDSVRIDKGRLRVAPGVTHTAILAAFTHGRTTATVFELDDAMVAHGLSAASARLATSYSPLLRRLDYGVYGLVGRTPAASEITQSRASVLSRAMKALKSCQVEADGTVLLTYDITVDNTRALPIPSGVVAPGAWSLLDGTTTRPIAVREHYITHIGSRAREAASQGKTELRLVFRPSNLTVRYAVV